MPGGGPALDSSSWVTTKHPTHKNRLKPFLVDVEELGDVFRDQFIAGLRRLIRSGKLRLEDKFARLNEADEREAWLDALGSTAWNVYVQGPPHGQSDPVHVVKYLARYMSGGPIADRRIISQDDDKITFWARTNDKRNKSEPFTLRGTEFVRRWSMNILPKGYTRSRSYGGYHGTKRAGYLARCRQMLDVATTTEGSNPEPQESPEPSLPKCERCKTEMACIASDPRPSWNDVFTKSVYREPVYCPLLHIHFGGLKDPSSAGYG